jgi:hypothetical protein
MEMRLIFCLDGFLPASYNLSYEEANKVMNKIKDSSEKNEDVFVELPTKECIMMGKDALRKLLAFTVKQ